MPFNSGGQTYQGGSYIFQGLSNLGDALQRWQMMNQQAEQADQLMEALHMTPDPTDTGDPNNPDKPKRTILDQKSYERYLAVSKTHRAAAAAGLQGALQMYVTMQKQADEHRLNEAHAKYYENRMDPRKELQVFDNPTTRTIAPEPGGPQFTPFSIFQKSPQQWERIPAPGEIHYDPETGQYFMTGGKDMKPILIDPAKMATADALKPKRSPTPAPGGSGGAQWYNPASWFSGPGATPTPTPGPASPAAQAPPSPVPQGGGGAPSISAAPSAKVHVQHPDGTTGWIPAAQLQTAIAAGYKQIP